MHLWLLSNLYVLVALPLIHQWFSASSRSFAVAHHSDTCVNSFSFIFSSTCHYEVLSVWLIYLQCLSPHLLLGDFWKLWCCCWWAVNWRGSPAGLLMNDWLNAIFFTGFYISFVGFKMINFCSFVDGLYKILNSIHQQTLQSCSNMVEYKKPSTRSLFPSSLCNLISVLPCGSAVWRYSACSVWPQLSSIITTAESLHSNFCCAFMRCKKEK